MAVSELADLDVLIVDCQTTGATPALGSVLEIGWCVTRANSSAPEAIASHWIALPEGHKVSPQVRQLTGFDDAYLADAMTPGEAWAALRASTNHKQLVPAAMHFASFELRFLRDWSNRFEAGVPFPLDTVCVHAIACRLYPELPRRSLRALAGFLGHGVDLARRAEGHVEGTAFIWRKLTLQLAENGIRTWQELQTWLATPAPKSKRKSSYPMPKDRYRSLPDEPGVYRFLRSNGDVLYVGKATSLRKRVSSHFTQRSSAKERGLEMLTQAHDIRFSRTATALEAALLESDEIKSLRPQYNIQLLEGERAIAFTSRDFSTAVTVPDRTHRCGPLPSVFSLRPLAALCALLSGEEHSAALRGGVVGAQEIWAPDVETFAAGFALFSQRHLSGYTPFATLSPRLQTLNLGKRLLSLARSSSDADDEDQPDETRIGWDPERVCRHMERAISQAYQVLRRGNVLCILANSEIWYHEAGAASARLIVVREGEVHELRDAESEAIEAAEVVSMVRAQSANERDIFVPSAYFRPRVYDRLRILVTELKRVLRDGGSVRIRLPRSRTLTAQGVERLLRWA
jgi:DNA polymerase-3 subunit epsilon